MRRRTRLAALPVHRHSLPQIVVDAGLVALAYFLAYRLRFDGGVPTDYQQLFENTISFVVIGNVAIPLSPVLSDEQAAEVVGAVRSARLQHQ